MALKFSRVLKLLTAVGSVLLGLVACQPEDKKKDREDSVEFSNAMSVQDLGLMAKSLCNEKEQKYLALTNRKSPLILRKGDEPKGYQLLVDIYLHPGNEVTVHYDTSSFDVESKTVIRRLLQKKFTASWKETSAGILIPGFGLITQKKIGSDKIVQLKFFTDLDRFELFDYEMKLTLEKLDQGPDQEKMTVFCRSSKIESDSKSGSSKTSEDEVAL